MHLSSTFLLTTLFCLLSTCIAFNHKHSTSTSIAHRQFRPKRAILDICASLNLSLFADVLHLLPLSTELDVCLCLSTLPLAIEADINLQILTDLVGRDAIEALIRRKGQQCSYPPHSQPLCKVGKLCDFSCDGGFQKVGYDCVCKAPSVVCNGVCGAFHHGCPSPVPRPKEKRAAVTPRYDPALGANSNRHSREPVRLNTARRRRDRIYVPDKVDSLVSPATANVSSPPATDLYRATKTVVDNVIKLNLDLDLLSPPLPRTIKQGVGAVIDGTISLLNCRVITEFRVATHTLLDLERVLNVTFSGCSSGAPGLAKMSIDLGDLLDSTLQLVSALEPLAHESSGVIVLNLTPLLNELLAAGIDVRSFLGRGFRPVNDLSRVSSLNTSPFSTPYPSISPVQPSLLDSSRNHSSSTTNIDHQINLLDSIQSMVNVTVRLNSCLGLLSLPSSSNDNTVEALKSALTVDIQQVIHDTLTLLKSLTVGDLALASKSLLGSVQRLFDVISGCACGDLLGVHGLSKETDDLLALTQGLVAWGKSIDSRSKVPNPILADLNPLLDILTVGGVEVDVTLADSESSKPRTQPSSIPTSRPPTPSIYSTSGTILQLGIQTIIEGVIDVSHRSTALAKALLANRLTSLASNLLNATDSVVRSTLTVGSVTSYHELIASLQLLSDAGQQLSDVLLGCDHSLLTTHRLGYDIRALLGHTNALLGEILAGHRLLDGCGCASDKILVDELLSSTKSSVASSSGKLLDTLSSIFV